MLNRAIERVSSKYRAILLTLALALCVLITLFANFYAGVDRVYTHLYYVPIILAGIWYFKKAFYVALGLGIFYVVASSVHNGLIDPDAVLRFMIFLMVAGVVSSLASAKERLHKKELKTERAFRKLATDLRLVLESTDQGIYATDVEGHCTLANTAAARMLGYGPEELIGRHMHQLIHHTKADGTPCSLDECCVTRCRDTGKGCRVGDDIFWRKDGEPFPVEYSSYPIVDDEKTVGAVVAFNYISRRKQDETELREARARAEMFNDLLGHDINNMNQIGIGYLELVLETGTIDGESRALLEKPLETLRNSSMLIDNVRKLQEIKTPPERLKPVDVDRLLSDVKAHYSGVDGGDVSISLAGSGRCRVKANDLLKDVFSNLVGNAIKHARGPVRVKVEADEVTMDDGTYCKVSVEDDGPGIPDDLKPRLFSRFQRGDTKAHGKGLGLYLVKTLVESYGGSVRVEDRVRGDPTKGARFVVLLPAAQ